MHVTTHTKTNDNQTRRGKGSRTQTIQRPPVWRPEPSGLTRAELRRIVIDTLG